MDSLAAVPSTNAAPKRSAARASAEIGAAPENAVQSGRADDDGQGQPISEKRHGKIRLDVACDDAGHECDLLEHRAVARERDLVLGAAIEILEHDPRQARARGHGAGRRC